MAEAETIFPAADRHNMELRAVAEIERLPGVLTAAVWLTPEGRLRDARIHASPGTAAVIICNATARVLDALSIPFDSGDIRVSHLAIAGVIESPLPAQSGRFLILQDITMSRSGAHLTCRVQL